MGSAHYITTYFKKVSSYISHLNTPGLRDFSYFYFYHISLWNDLMEIFMNTDIMKTQISQKKIRMTSESIKGHIGSS